MSDAYPEAIWSNGEGYEARVWLTDKRDLDARAMWGWELFWPGGHTTNDAGAEIGTPWFEHDPDKVLCTLASFLNAWDEALDYEQRFKGHRSDNGDLFPRDCIEFLPAVEEFALWAYDKENPDGS